VIEDIVKVKLEVLTKKVNNNDEILISENILLEDEPKKKEFPLRGSLSYGRK
jgi:hypothetical protein